MNNYNSNDQTSFSHLSEDVVSTESSVLGSVMLDKAITGIKAYMRSLEQRHPGITDQLVSTTIIGVAATAVADAIQILSA